MTYVTDPYDALYTNLKNRFTVIYEGAECTVGDYMLMKAGKRKASNLPAAPVRDAYEHRALTSIVEFVNEKLTVKKPPIKDKTIKRFPFKTSISALLSSAAACALVLSCGIFALSGANKATPSVTADSESYSSFELNEEIVPTEYELPEADN
ncbi:MAG: hypothetical protein IJX38_04120 [Clostridia bacterium]|nr:hypothetical protein [Clostridia bacterium]